MEKLGTLKEMRERRGFSIRELATESGLNRGGLSLWERGKNPISEKGATRLSEIYDIPIVLLASLQRIHYGVDQYYVLRTELNEEGEDSEENGDSDESIFVDGLGTKLSKLSTRVMEVRPSNSRLGHPAPELSNTIEELRYGVSGFILKQANVSEMIGPVSELPQMDVGEGIEYRITDELKISSGSPQVEPDIIEPFLLDKT
ncbi:MAG: helix-turn-helix domain-containing protein [bacterium]